MFLTLIRPFRSSAEPPALARLRRGSSGVVQMSAPFAGGIAELEIGKRGDLTVRRRDSDGKVVLTRQIAAEVRDS